MRYVLLIGLLFTTPVMADSRRAVATIGSLIAAERFCGLRYDADILNVWIDDRVHRSNRDFFNQLDATITRSERRQHVMTGPARQAHCRSVFAAASHYGFLEDGGNRSTGVAHATTRQRRATR